MNITLLYVLVAIVAPPAASALYWLATRHRFNFLAGWIGGGVGNSIADVAQRQWLAVIFACAGVALAVVLWWLSRRKRKRILDALGAKSKALRDALVRRTREAAQPRPVLRPAPGGVR